MSRQLDKLLFASEKASVQFPTRRAILSHHRRLGARARALLRHRGATISIAFRFSRDMRLIVRTIVDAIRAGGRDEAQSSRRPASRLHLAVFFFRLRKPDEGTDGENRDIERRLIPRYPLNRATRFLFSPSAPIDYSTDRSAVRSLRELRYETSCARRIADASHSIAVSFRIAYRGRKV